MGIVMKKFTEEHLERAVDIFLKIYAYEREVNPLLPPHLLNEPERVENWLRLLIQTGPGVTLFQDGHMLAYMVTGDRFRFKGQKAVMVPEYAHGAEIDTEISWNILYREMYRELSTAWGRQGIQLHLMGFLAHDHEVKDILFDLGFGGLLAERIRDLSDFPYISVGRVTVEELQDGESLIPIHRDHMAYYSQSPLFLKKPADLKDIKKGVQEYFDDENLVLVVREEGEIGAYLVVGESARGAEGFLLQQTNTAQIKSLYVKPALRARGIGASLLMKGIEWAREEGFDALFVEHETANTPGSQFWGRYFDPYVYFAMRYVEDTLSTP
ncbi:MAG: GNAT family N-acetyltransferase [Spirochaetales bacterium]|nr:GNAT family N-acetyltransferase [Spirochaetales bacterium]